MFLSRLFLTNSISSVGRVIGTGVFSTPSSILNSVGSVGASLMLWVLGFLLSFCGLFIWLELGTMFPRSGGEKVYLEAIYKRPKHLATVFFAANAIILGFSASNSIVSATASENSDAQGLSREQVFASKCVGRKMIRGDALMSCGQYTRLCWPPGGPLGCTWYCHWRSVRRGSTSQTVYSSPFAVISFATLLHGVTPRLGVVVINVSFGAGSSSC